MSKKNGRQTIGSEFIEQLAGSPLELLTTPIYALKAEHKPINENKNSKESNHNKTPMAQEKPISQLKERMTVQISKDTIERVKDCVYWNRTTIAQFVEDALEVALKEAENENGNPFQKRRSELKPGRPTK